MKGKITSEYIRRVKKLCRSKLNGGNLIDGIIPWAVGVVRYRAGIVDWTMEEVANMDRRTRKILAMNGCLHTRSNGARLYLPRKEGGRGLIGIEFCALGSISKGAMTWFGKLDVPDFLGGVQLSAILGTAHLLRKVLCL